MVSSHHIKANGNLSSFKYILREKEACKFLVIFIMSNDCSGWGGSFLKNGESWKSVYAQSKKLGLAYKFSYRKISQINVKAAKSKILLWKTSNDICIVKELRTKSRFYWEMRNGSRKTLDFLRLWRAFRFFFGMKFSFSEECSSISLL
jgi:hypothetical protein